MKSQMNRSYALSSVMASLALLLAACSAWPATPAPAPAQSAAEASTPTTAMTTPETPSATPAPTAPVKIDGGVIVGSAAGDVESFKGIPYAAPPIGDLRWRAPQPVQPWADVRETPAFVHDCMQPEGDFEPIQTTPSEDCLHLNVWRPTNAPADAKLPVLFWIHGGFVGGGTSIPFYDGSAFARQGIVVVSPNYRLGRLGFFAHPALLKANEGPAGNFGYMDQIAAFGGDPSKVTIIGQSAGGASVLALFTSPVTKGLFYQAMVMSGAV